VTTARGQSETCPGRIASQAFRYGLCSCKDVVAWGAIASDAYDSTQGPMSPATMSNGGGAIGINGGFTGAGLFIPGGSVTVAGPQGLSLPGQVSIFGDLRVAGTLTALSVTVSTVSHNAWFGGAMTGGGALGVSGDVHQPVGAERSVVLTVGGKDVREPVHIDPPCPCGEKEFLDVAAIVADGKQNNHNTDAAFDPANLANVATDLRVELPCGRLYVPSFKVQATLTMSVQGKTALLIDGDMQVTGTLALELGPDADLDIFVGGNLVLNALKSPANLRPANLRLYVGGAGDIKLPMSGFSGNLYAPRAAVTASGSQALFGSVFAGNFTAAGWTTIHYDTSVVAEGNDCKPPDECNDCTGCAATSACIGGHCGTCSTDADCCQPLTCYAGKCQPLILL
jgi:hypothetical protein